MLLENLIKYQKDQGPPRMDSFRHSKLYIKTRECVQFGDINLNRLVDHQDVESCKGKLWRSWTGQRGWMSVGGLIGESSREEYEVGQTNDQPRQSSVQKDEEDVYRFCRICRREGPKSTTCPLRGDLPKAPRKLPRCLRCGVVELHENVCGNPTKPWEVPFMWSPSILVPEMLHGDLPLCCSCPFFS
jgi:hypothetical protein